MFSILLLVIYFRLSSLATVRAIDQGLKLFIVEAALERNLEVLRWLVNKEAFINVRDDKGLTPLMYASTMDDPTEVMQVLLAGGADADLKDDKGKTALHFASEIGNLEAVELLVDQMKNTSITDNKGRTALHFAVNSDNGYVLSFLINKGLDYKAKDKNGFTAFHAAAMIGNTRMLEFFKDRHIVLELETTNRTTPLMLAFLFEQNEAGKYLIDLGANVNSQDINTWTALHYVAYYGNLKLVKLLVENNATLDMRNSDGLTPLHLAVNNGHYNIVEYLSDKGANIYNIDNYNNTLLHGAAASGNIDLLKHLTEKIHELDALNALNYNPLIEAALEGNQDTVTFLIKAGADTGILNKLGQEFLLKELSANNTKLLKSLKQIDGNFEFCSINSLGKTLLHYASRTSNIDTVKHLIHAMIEEHLKKIKGSTIQVDQSLLFRIEICLSCFNNITNMRDNEGKTPLYYAAEWGNTDAVEILVKYGTDQRYADNKGQTAFHIAAKIGRTDVLKKLAPPENIINLLDKQSKSAIFLSAQEGKLDSLRYLITLGADLTIKDSKGWSLLHAATANGHNAVVQEILRHKYFVSTISDADKDGRPPSWYAINLGHIDILETLELNGARIRQDHLCEAVENNNEEFVKYLTRKNGTQVVTACFKNKITLLHIAATKGHTNLLKHLTKYSCLVNSLDLNNRSPLWYAVNEQKWDSAKDIKEAGGVIKPTVSPLDAVKNNMTITVKYFVEEGISFTNNSLHEASSRGYTDLVKELVKISSLINAYDHLHRTPLWYAVNEQMWDCAKTIKEAGGVIQPIVSSQDAVKNNLIGFVKYYVKEGTSFPDTSLHEAASRGYTDIVKELVKISSLINARDNLQKSPLWYAVNEQHWGCVKIIKEAGGVIKPLISSLEAVKGNLIGFVKYFVEEGVSFPNNSLHEAASRGYIDLVKELVNISSLINAYDTLHRTPLWYALSEQKWDIAKEIKMAGGVIKPIVSPVDAVENNLIGFVRYFVNEGVSFTNNSLHEAASKGYIDIVEELVKISSLVNACDHLRRTPLWYAVNKQNWNCAKFIKEAGGVIKPTVSPLDAVKNNWIAFVKYFVNEGVSFTDNALHTAALRGYTDIVKELVKNAMLINAHDLLHKTPLWYAIKGENWDCVDLLENAGGKINPEYSFEQVVEKNLLGFVKYLIKKGVSVHSTTREGIPLVYRSAALGYNDILEYFLDSGADINVLNARSNDSMVIIATFHRHCDTVRLLLQRGAFVNAVNYRGRTALDYIYMNFNHMDYSDRLYINFNCKQVLLQYGAKTAKELLN